MREERHGDQVDELHDHKAPEGGLDGRADVLAGVEGGRNDLERNEPDEADRIPHNGECGLAHVVGREASALKEEGDECLAREPEADGRGHGDEDDEPQSPVEERVVARRVALRIGARETREEHGAERNAQKRRRELHQAVGVVEPGDRALAEMGGDVRVDENRKLCDAHAEKRGHHELEDAPDVTVGQTVPKPAGTHPDPEPAKRQILGAELQYAAQDHRHGKRPDGLGHARREKHRAADEGEVEENGRHRRHRKALPGVEDGSGKRRERHEGDVGEHEAGERAREVEGLGVRRKAARDRPDEQRRRHDAEDARGEDRKREHGEDVVDEGARLALASLLHVGEHRNEGLLEGPLRKEAAQHVRKPEGNVECVCLGRGAEEARDEHVADHARDAAHQSQA